MSAHSVVRPARDAGQTDVRAPRSGRTAGHAAWIWVVAFIAMHVYWYLGGRIGHPGDLPEASLDAFSVAVSVLFIAGVIVPMASVSRWGRVIPRWILLVALWTGCAILLLRGGAGVVDEVLRVTDLSATGLTGLTREEVTGSAHPSANVLWSGRATDAFFVFGGILFGLAAYAFHGTRHTTAPDRPGRRLDEGRNLE